MNPDNKVHKIKGQNGFGIPELIIVLLVISILVVLALPKITTSRRQSRFSIFKQQVATTLNETRQNAILQKNAITFRYDDTNKRIIIYGGDFGVLGDVRNQKTNLANNGLLPGEIIYGNPKGLSTMALTENSNITELSEGVVDITFQPDGSVVNADNNPTNKTLYFHNSKSKKETAFAVSVSGEGGKTKIWRYSKGVDAYLE
jgi:prepilin-type N-terminal cleavage/methylation domain-containing protein